MATDVLISIMLDNRRALKDGTFPVKLRITYKRERKYYQTEFSYSESDFERVLDPKARGKFKEDQLKLKAIETTAAKVIESLSVFSFSSFQKRYIASSTNEDVFAAFDHTSEKLKAAGQIRTAQSYDNASISILSFINKESVTRNKGLSLKEAKAKRDALIIKKKPLPFSDVNPEFLKNYEKWMLQNGKSTTTIGIYLRNLRALFNEVIASGDLHIDFYPFGKKMYQIPASKNIKKALTDQELDKIFSYKPRHILEAKARDLWIFSFLCNGMNIKDIAHLKYKDKKNDAIYFIRAKTERTTRHDQKKIEVILTSDALQIIEKWGNKPALPNTNIFPILNDGLSSEEEIKTLNQAIKTINTYMKKIANEVGIEKNLTTYAARHSYSTFLKRKGASTELISEALGHASEKTTQNYLDSFESDVKRKFASMLPGFKK